MMTLRTRRTPRLTWLRRPLTAAAGAALFVVCTAAVAATAHPVAHPVTRSTEGKGHVVATHSGAKAKAEPVVAHTGARKDRAFAVPAKATARSKNSASVAVKSPTAKGRRIEVDDDAPVAKGHAKAGASSKSSKAAQPKADTAKARARAKQTAKPAPSSGKGNVKSRHRAQPPADDADNDPPVIHRASATRGTSSAAKVPGREEALVAPPQAGHEAESASTETGSAFAAGEMKGHHERRPGPAATAAKHGSSPASPAAQNGGAETRTDNTIRTEATSEDFLRAAGVARMDAPADAEHAEVFAHGESHPDDDVRVDMRVPVAARRVAAIHTPAIVTAMPAAAASQGPRLKKTAKVDTMPDDLAGKNAVIEEAMTPMVLPNIYTTGGRLVMPPPMKGSHDILVHQNTMADSDGLSRIQDDDDLNRMRAAHLLVAIPESDALEVNSELPMNRRYARPWTARFVQDTARAYYARFHEPLRLSSAVRTVAYQLRLQRVNGNAAAVDGDAASPHLTGQAIDFGKHGMTVAEIAWMRAYLGPIMDAGKIDVEEEFQQACFHISVYKAYVPAAVKKPRAMEVAQVHPAPIVRRAPKLEGPSDEAPDASPNSDSQQ